jgi:hypothetical protein
MFRAAADRFDLNADFIEKHNLSWIDNLETGSGRSLADPRHKDHKCDYVQRYIREFGVRKVEANTLVTRPQAGRDLCREAILKYLPSDSPRVYEAALAPHRERVKEEIFRQLKGTFGSDGA